jgi:hypothetical protein
MGCIFSVSAKNNVPIVGCPNFAARKLSTILELQKKYRNNEK